MVTLKPIIQNVHCSIQIKHEKIFLIIHCISLIFIFISYFIVSLTIILLIAHEIRSRKEIKMNSRAIRNNKKSNRSNRIILNKSKSKEKASFELLSKIRPQVYSSFRMSREKFCAALRFKTKKC